MVDEDTRDERDDENEGSEGADDPMRVHPRPANGGNGARTSARTAASTPKRGHVGVGNPDYEGWSNKEADLMFGEMLGNEHPKCLKKSGRTVHDLSCDIVRLDGREAVKLGSFEASAVSGSKQQSPGDMLQYMVEDKFHLPLASGPGLYEVRFVWKQDNRIYGRGRMALASPSEIIAVRRARAQQQEPQPSPQQQPYVPPPQPAPAPQYPQQPQPGMGYAQPPHGYAPQQPYQQLPYPQQPGASHDPEVSALRAEVGELRGSLSEMLSFMRERRDYRGEPPPAAAAAVPPGPPQPPLPSPGVGAPPPYARSPYDSYRESHEMRAMRGDIADLKDTVADVMTIVKTIVRGPQPQAPVGVGAAGAGQGGQGGSPAPAAAAVAAPAAAPPAPDVEKTIVAVLDRLGVRPGGAGLGSPFAGFAQQAHEMKRAFGAMRSLRDDIDNMLGDMSAEPEPSAAETPPQGAAIEKPEPEPELPFEVITVPDTKLFGHDAKYTPNKRTGKIDVEGFVMSNPGVLEKGFELLGAAVDGIKTLATQAAKHSGQAPHQQPQQPAHVVREIPAAARDASVGTGATPAAPGGRDNGWPSV